MLTIKMKKGTEVGNDKVWSKIMDASFCFEATINITVIEKSRKPKLWLTEESFQYIFKLKYSEENKETTKPYKIK